jgi:Ca-activated chloride channel homolog
MMSRKLLPIIIAMVVLFVILRKGERPDESPPDEERKAQTARKAKKTSAYALDVQRSNWPPLEEGTAPATTGTLTTVNYYLVFDGSGSMLSSQCGGGTTKFDAALKAVRDFIATIPEDANVGLAAFDRRAISERVPLAGGSREALYGALQEIRAGSNTPLRSAIKIGYDKLTDQARTQLGYGEYHLVVVTDGDPDPRDEDPSPVVREILRESPVVLHTVGFCIDDDHVLNQRDRTNYAAATNPEQLRQSLQAVLAEAPVFDAASFGENR